MQPHMQRCDDTANQEPEVMQKWLNSTGNNDNNSAGSKEWPTLEPSSLNKPRKEEIARRHTQDDFSENLHPVGSFPRANNVDERVKPTSTRPQTKRFIQRKAESVDANLLRFIYNINTTHWYNPFGYMSSSSGKLRFSNTATLTDKKNKINLKGKILLLWNTFKKKKERKRKTLEPPFEFLNAPTCHDATCQGHDPKRQKCKKVTMGVF